MKLGFGFGLCGILSWALSIKFDEPSLKNKYMILVGGLIIFGSCLAVIC